jgi:SAM-dependent methyltransferase
MTQGYEIGCRMPLADWLWLNREGAFRYAELRRFVSPFPPRELMKNVSGLVEEADFASHGADFFMAITEASPKPLIAFESILDFGCGCGRLARMFKGHPYRIEGCDIDRRHVDWINHSLDFMHAEISSVKPPIPYEDNEFEAVISISIFTHLNEENQDEFLSELARVTAPGGNLFLTVHGARALARAVGETPIRHMLDIPEEPFREARQRFAEGGHAFILQHGHLTTSPVAQGSLLDELNQKLKIKPVIDEPFEYGITFIPESYVRDHWRKWFDIIDYRSGALHDFQDLIILKPRK